jgi:tRNA A58 N-methylase Trm61
MGTLLRRVDRIRTTRHRVEHPDSETWIDADAVLADLPAARELVDAADKAIRHLSVFVP